MRRLRRTAQIAALAVCATLIAQPATAATIGRVVGSVFEDVDGDGVFDAGEPTLGGITVTVTDSLAVERSQQTSLNGRFNIAGEAGAATVTVDVPAELVVTTANASQSVVIIGGTAIPASDIGLQAKPTVSPGVIGVIEGNTGSIVASVPVTLSAPSDTEVTVDWTTADSPGNAAVATGDVDYAAASGTVTFAPGSTQEFIDITVFGDLEVESAFGAELAIVVLSNISINANPTPTGGFFGNGIIAILNDD